MAVTHPSPTPSFIRDACMGLGARHTLSPSPSPPMAGELERADHWQDRFRHLNYSMHNYLRITRILKSLGEFQYEHFKGPFVRFVLHEAIVKRTLTRTLDSCMNYWVEVIRDDEERGSIRTWAKELAQKS